METEEVLNDKIMKITGQIKEKYPELYSSLGEMPVTIPGTKTPVINANVLKEYYESLVYTLKSYETTHQK